MSKVKSIKILILLIVILTISYPIIKFVLLVANEEYALFYLQSTGATYYGNNVSSLESPNKGSFDRIREQLSRNDTEISMVVIWNPSFAPGQIDVLRYIRDLECLECINCPINDNMAQKIAECRYLENLELFGADITSSGLSSLSKLPLKKLGIGLSKVTDFSSLSKLNTLESLSLYKNKVSGSLDFLINLKNLKRLSLDSTDVTNSDLKTISQIPNLKYLSLRDCRISTQGISELVNLRNLEVLNLDKTDVDNNSLALLPLLQSLKEVTIDETNTTFEASNKFRKENTKIHLFDSIHTKPLRLDAL